MTFVFLLRSGAGSGGNLLDACPAFFTTRSQYARCRTRAKTPRNLALADRLAANTLANISYFQRLNPDLIFFIETIGFYYALGARGG